MKISHTIFLYIIIFLSSANLYGYEINMEDSDFKPSATFNIRVALLAAYSSKLAYDDNDDELRIFLRNHGFYGFSQHSISAGILDTQFFVANKSIEIDGAEKNLVLISFRGTTFDQVGDILTNIDSTSVFYEQHGNVHKGFYESSKIVRNSELYIDIEDRVNHWSDLSSVIETAEYQNTVFLIVGHSLGGAIATLYSTSLLNRGIPKSKILVYTYGAPSVGDMTYVNTYDGNLYLHRVRNKYDPIPFAAYIDTLIDTGNSAVNMGVTFFYLGLTSVKNLWQSTWNNYPYKHIGYMRVFDQDGFDITDTYGNMNIFSSGRLLLNLSEHYIDKYIQNLEGYYVGTPGDEYVHSWNGNASIIHLNGSSAVSDGSQKFGVNMDITQIHPSGFNTPSKPVVFFQWQVNFDKGKTLEISASGYNGKASISYGPWNKANKNKRSYFNVSLPFILDPSKDFTHDNGNWYVIAVSFYEKVDTTITVMAEAVNKMGSSYTSSPFQEVLIENSESPYSWTGNGSIISRTVDSSSDEHFGVNIDYAYVESVKYPVSVAFFQWEVDKQDGAKLEISSPDNCVSRARLVYGPWNDRSKDISGFRDLPYKLDPTLNDFSVEPNGDNGPWYVVAVIPRNMSESRSRCIIQAKPVD
jgi:hypothetical protein